MYSALTWDGDFSTTELGAIAKEVSASKFRLSLPLNSTEDVQLQRRLRARSTCSLRHRVSVLDLRSAHRSFGKRQRCPDEEPTSICPNVAKNRVRSKVPSNVTFTLRGRVQVERRGDGAIEQVLPRRSQFAFVRVLSSRDVSSR